MTLTPTLTLTPTPTVTLTLTLLGIEFGPDHLEKFLRAGNFNTMVRSHEAVPEGVEKSTKGEGPLCNLPADLTLWTIFSASNYSDGANDAAVLHWYGIKEPHEVHKIY